MPRIDPRTGMTIGRTSPSAYPFASFPLGRPDPWFRPKSGVPGAPPAPPGTSAGASPSGTVGPSGTAPIDYRALIEQDPFFRQIRSDLDAQGVADLSQRNALINRALVGFGEIPDFAQAQQALGLDFGSVVDPTTAGLAQQNTQAGLSQAARMEKLRADNIRAIRNVLAARGALRSGELGYQLGEEQLRYTQGQYDARQQLADLIGSIQAGYVAGQRGRSMSSYEAMIQAYGRQLGLLGDDEGESTASTSTSTTEPTTPTPPGEEPQFRPGVPTWRGFEEATRPAPTPTWRSFEEGLRRGR